MKIAVLMPLWKRPEVFKEVLDNWRHPSKKFKIQELFFFVISPTDSDINELMQLCNDFLAKDGNSGMILQVENLPVGQKMNDSIKIMLNYEWDYLMNIGSDNILSDDYWNAFFPYLYERIDMIAMDGVVFVDTWSQSATKGKYPIVGAGRLIKRFIIEDTISKLGFLYHNYLNSGLDTSSMMNIKKATDCDTTIIEGCFSCDLKTLTNIHIYDEIKHLGDESSEINASGVTGFGNLSEICTRIADYRRIQKSILG